MTVLRRGIVSLALMNPMPVSDSCVEDISASMTLLFMRMGAFAVGACWSRVIGSCGLSLKNK